MKEKRKYPRVVKKIKSEVHSTDGMTFSTSTDLSHGGIFISTPEPVTIGSEVQLSIRIPGGENIDVKGIVKWKSSEDTENNRNGMGIEFVEINENIKGNLKKIIDS